MIRTERMKIRDKAYRLRKKEHYAQLNREWSKNNRLKRIEQCKRYRKNDKHHNTRVTWTSIKSRCYNPKHEHFYLYGGRGIIVCERWKNSFQAFLEDMGDRPLNTTIDRKDNNLGYNKENCRWVTWEIQQNNKRTNRIITENGKSLTITQWSKELNVTTKTISNRLKKYNSVYGEK